MIAKSLVSPSEAAGIMGVSDETVRRWIRTNRLPAIRTPGGTYKVRVADLPTEPTYVGQDRRLGGPRKPRTRSRRVGQLVNEVFNSPSNARQVRARG